jgi:hypothetical protein
MNKTYISLRLPHCKTPNHKRSSKITIRRWPPLSCQRINSTGFHKDRAKGSIDLYKWTITVEIEGTSGNADMEAKSLRWIVENPEITYTVII